jgi:serine/threonine protein kinase
MSLTPGTRLGPYEIVSAIGAGGMGEVYRAIDSHLKRSVAIKVLPASVAGDADRLGWPPPKFLTLCRACATDCDDDFSRYRPSGRQRALRDGFVLGRRSTLPVCERRLCDARWLSHPHRDRRI